MNRTIALALGVALVFIALCAIMLVILPGPLMSATERHAGFLRIPFIAEPESLRTGIKRLAAAWREYQSGARRETPMAAEQHLGMV